MTSTKSALGMRLGSALVLLTLCGHAAAQYDFTWTGAAGTNGWGDTAVFSPGPPPVYINNWGVTGNPPPLPGATDTVYIGTANVVGTVVDPTAARLDLGTTASLSLGNGYALELYGDSTFDGELRLSDSAASGVADLRVHADLAIDGVGRIKFTTNCGNRLTSMTATDTLTIGSDIEVETEAGCQGEIRCELINNGTIDARDVGTIRLGTYDKTNNALIWARTGSTVRVDAITIDNKTGTFTVDGTSTLHLEGAIIDGGAIDGSGSVVVGGSTRWLGLDVDGISAHVGNGEFIALVSTLTNDATLRLEDSGASGTAELRIDGNVAMDGTGRVLFTTNAGNRLTSVAAADVLTLGAGQTVATEAASCQGEIRTALVNYGTVDADGGKVELTTENKTNHSLMQARNGGTLRLNGITLTNTGTVRADDTATLALENATIDGGQIDAASTATVALNGSTFRDASFDGGGGAVSVENTCALDGGTATDFTATVRDNDTLRLHDVDPADAVIQLADGGASGHAELLIDGPASLTGASEVLFTTGAGNRVASAAPGDILTLAPGVRLATSAAGTQGEVRAAMLNQGTVEAAFGSLYLNTEDKANSGLMRARDGGTLYLDGITLNNAGGSLRADAGSQVVLQNCTVLGGDLGGDGDYTVQSGVQIGGLDLNGGTVYIGNADTLTLLGDTHSDASIRLVDDGASGEAVLRIGDSLTVSGTGDIVCGSIYSNRFLAAVPAYVLTLGPSQTLRTQGTTFATGDVFTKLNNQGVVDADAGTLTFKGEDITNPSLIRARNGGRLRFENLTIQNAGGTVQADAASDLVLFYTTVVGGTVSGAVDIDDVATFEGVHLDGATATVSWGERLTVLNGLTLDGEIRLADTSSAGDADLVLGSSLAPTGTGRIVFGTQCTNEILAADPSHVLTVTPTQALVAEPGAFGRIQAGVINQGLIDADAGTIELRTEDKTNQALVRARNGGHLQITGITVENAGGTLEADGTSDITTWTTTVHGGAVSGTLLVRDWTMLDDVHFDGATAHIGNGEWLGLRSGLTLDGSIRLEDASSSGDAELRLYSSLAPSGAGSIEFATSYTNKIVADDAAYVLTVLPSQAIRALPSCFGRITPLVTNQGLIDIDGGRIELRTEDKTNQADIRVRNGGRLDIVGITLENTGGTLTADGTSEIVLWTSAVRGGLVEGPVTVADYATFEDVTFATGTASVSNGERLTLRGMLGGDGAIRLEDTGASSEAYLTLDSDIAPTGDTRIVCASAYHNRITANDPGYQLTLGPTQAVETLPGGYGEIEAALGNLGLVDANAGTIELRSLGKTNRALIRARDGGRVYVNMIGIDNVGGAIEADATSDIVLRQGVIQGGTVGGLVLVDGYATLDDVHLDAATVQVGEYEWLGLATACTNDGTIVLADGGRSGEADLRISADMTVDGGGRILCDTGYRNRVESDGGDDTLTLGPAQTFEVRPGCYGESNAGLLNHGTVRVDGLLVMTGTSTLTNAPTGRIVGSGTLDTSGTPDFVNHGTVAPGASAGILTFVGGYSQEADATLAIDILGPGGAGVDHDQLAADTCALGGHLVLARGGYEPDYAEVFRIVESGGRTGHFDTVGGVSVTPDKCLAVVYDATGADAVSALPGDFNLDGIVDTADYFILSGSWFDPGLTWADGDATGDGICDTADYFALSTHWYDSVPGFPVAGGPVTATPEPATLALVGAGLLGLLRRRR